MAKKKPVRRGTAKPARHAKAKPKKVQPKTAKKTAKTRTRPASSKSTGAEIFDEPVAPDLAEEIAKQTEHAMQLLFPGDKKAKPKAIATAILNHVDAIHRGKVRVSPKERAGLTLALACLWGDAVVRELEWAQVRWKDGGSIGIVEPKRRFVLYPLPYMKRMLEDPEVDNTILLLFNMLVGGNVPDAAPGSYVSFG